MGGAERRELTAGVPIIPFAAAGVDDTYRILATIAGSGEALMGHDKYDLPLLWGHGPLPVPVPFWFRIGASIHPRHERGAAEDHGFVREIHRRVWSQAQTLLDELVAEWRR